MHYRTSPPLPGAPLFYTIRSFSATLFRTIVPQRLFPAPHWFTIRSFPGVLMYTIVPSPATNATLYCYGALPCHQGWLGLILAAFGGRFCRRAYSGLMLAPLEGDWRSSRGKCDFGAQLDFTLSDPSRRCIFALSYLAAPPRRATSLYYSVLLGNTILHYRTSPPLRGAPLFYTI